MNSAKSPVWALKQDLIRIASLADADPAAVYRRDCAMRGFQIDRCQLYVYRCAVYFAETRCLDPEKLKWWNWKD